MEVKKYSSYAEIDREIEILKLDKEIKFKKLVLGIQKTKESFEPQNVLNRFISSYKTTISESYLDIVKISIPFIVRWFINRKRG